MVNLPKRAYLFRWEGACCYECSVKSYFESLKSETKRDRKKERERVRE